MKPKVNKLMMIQKVMITPIVTWMSINLTMIIKILLKKKKRKIYKIMMVTLIKIIINLKNEIQRI